MKREWLILFGIVILLGMVSADIISINSGGSDSLIINPGNYIEGFFFMENEEPASPVAVLFSLNGRNESDSNLICSVELLDNDGDDLNVSIEWFKDEVSQFVIDYNNSYSNGSIQNFTLLSTNLTLGDTWMCSARTNDGMADSSWGDSNNLTIIDITNPEVFIISPEDINYSTVNITFNVSTNEDVDSCLYNLDLLGNVSMTSLNSTYFWHLDNTLGPGPHEISFYCNDTSGNWGVNSTNFTVENDAAIAILLSSNLSWAVEWNIVTLPINDLDAIGNNLNSSTSYYINVSATNTLVDLYMRADGDLETASLDTLGLGNETFAVSLNDSTVDGEPRQQMNTSYIKIADSIGTSAVYLKFYLDAPANQAAGHYSNQLDFRAVRNGQTP